MVKPDTEFLLTTAAILTAVVTVYAKGKSILSGVRMSAKWITDRFNLPGKVLRLLESQGKAIAEIQAEVRTNGGHSLKDVINEIRSMAITADVRSHLAREVCPWAMYECTPDGKCIWGNEALCDLYGLDHEQVKGFGWSAAVEDSERDRVVATWQTALAKGIPYLDTYTIINQRTGKRSRVRTRATGYQHKGVIILFSGSVIPVQEA